MGYTNYWTPKKSAAFPLEFMDAAFKIVENSPVPLAAWDGEPGSEPTVQADKISLNGVGKDSCETFLLVPDGEWTFTKTRARPYDLIVKALLIMAERMDVLTGPFDFDGDRTDTEYADAVNYLDGLGL